MSTGMFNPPLIPPRNVLHDDMQQRAAALYVAQQVTAIDHSDDLVKLAAFVLDGAESFMRARDEITRQDEAQIQREQERNLANAVPVWDAANQSWTTRRTYDFHEDGPPNNGEPDDAPVSPV